MSGQKGPVYQQSGVAIANRTPFNKYVPNKRQTVNDGVAVFCTNTGGGIFPANDVPFYQGTSAAIELFLFCEDVPTRAVLMLDRRSDTQAVGEVDIEVPAISYSQCQVGLNATPSLIDGYTAYTSANGVEYGAIATGTTATGAVKVRGYALIGVNPEMYANEGTRTNGGEPVETWDGVCLDFSTRASCVNGYIFYNASGLDAPTATYPIILEESEYTQAIQDAGNLITEILVPGPPDPNTTLNFIVVGLYKTIPPVVLG
jgi:hypothetical protein